ncbi:MAG: SDR family oxidoreductase [Armatimonadetes bacterium]|nr:SDR family oxidoreductase [Armatimonadota bacterium]
MATLSSSDYTKMDFIDKVTVVTGGGQGIGRAIALAFGRCEADVAIVDLNIDAARSTAGEIQRNGARAIAVQSDVSVEAEVKSAVSQINGAFGRVDILVNNAGICRKVTVMDISSEEWDRFLAVNLKSVFLWSREVLPGMIERGYGKIINMASSAGKLGGVVAGSHYAAAKAGVICLTKSLARYAAPHRICVNAVCPGTIETELTSAWGEETKAAFAAAVPFGEFGTPEDVAGAVLFLASDSAKYITGEIVDINGGLIMD